MSLPGVDLGCIAFPATCAVDAIGDAASDAAVSAGESIFAAFAKMIWDAFVSMTNAVVGWWIDIGTPSVATNSATADIAGWTGTLIPVVLLIGTLIACIMVAVQGRGRPLGQVAISIITVIVVSAVGAKAVDIVVGYSDQFAAWLLTVGGLDLDGEWIDSYGEALLVANPNSMGLMLLAGLVGALAGLVQLGFMLLRIAVIVVFTAMLPLVAASASTAWGRVWLSRISAWLLAFILYKPVAALVIVSGFSLMESGISAGVNEESSFLPVAAGVVLISTSVIALPALLRLLNPLTTAATGVGGGGSAFAMGMAANAAAGMVVGGPKGAAAGAARGAATRTPEPDGGK